MREYYYLHARAHIGDEESGFQIMATNTAGSNDGSHPIPPYCKSAPPLACVPQFHHCQNVKISFFACGARAHTAAIWFRTLYGPAIGLEATAEAFI